MSESPSIPEGMVEVSKGKFYELIGNDPRDIMPNSQRMFTPWRTKNGQLVAWSLPGYANGVGTKATYAINTRAFAKAGAQ